MKILLLSDTTMCVDAGGISQTLYNIFLFANTKDLLLVTSKKSLIAYPPNKRYKQRYITYNFELINLPNTRFTKYTSFLFDWINYNYSIHLKGFKKVKQKIKEFNPDVIISCYNGFTGVCMHHKLLEKNTKKVFPYFMDDWMSQKTHTWLKKKINYGTKKILQENEDWLMINNNLSEILQERYNIKPTRVLEIHNPVDTSNLKLPEQIKNKDTYTIAYAGALWPMHYDAFLVMSKAIQLLKEKRHVNLIVYTSQSHWQWRKNDLEILDVEYGDNIPYQDIHAKLSDADCLLISASFTQEWLTHSKGSLQTKMTDYLKAGRLVISCGPSYSANNQFIKKYNCGICIETNDVKDAAKKLDEILNDIEQMQVLVENGFTALRKDLSFEKMHQKLQEFLVT